MTDTDKRKQREAIVAAAWADLALNESFRTVLDLDLQMRWNPFKPSFEPGDEGNTHKAAIRDGGKSVVSYILRRLNAGVAALEQDEDSPARPKEAVAEFQGNQQPTQA